VRRTTATTGVAAVGVVGPDGVGASYAIVTMPSPARSPAAEAAAS